jgi:hypothetical protein
MVVPARGPSSLDTTVGVGVSGDGDGDDLGVEVTGVTRLHGAVLRDHRPLVLLLPSDVAALGDVLGRHAHRDVDVIERALGAVELDVLGLLHHPRAQPGARHRLHPGRDVLVALAGADRVRRHPDRHQRRGAEAVDGAAGDVVVQAGEQRGVAPDVVALLPHAGGRAHEHVVGLGEVDVGVALDERPDRQRRQLIGAHSLQRALARASDGRADGVDDHCFGHGRNVSLLKRVAEPA